MTPQEQQMLNDLLGRIAQAPAAQRDAEADAMIQKALGSRPDALYLLTQLALINDIALKNAQQQIQSLQQRSQPAPSSSSFLGPWGSGGQANAPQQQQPVYNAPSGGFLHNALTTASGVIAGEVAFSALRSLFGGGMGGGFGGTGGGSFLSGAPGSETIVNNYYGDRADSDNFADNSDNTDNSSDLASVDDGSNDFSDNSDNSDFT